MLTEEQVNQFRTEGYVAVEGFWTAAEIAAIRAELDRLKAEGKLANVATDGDGKTTSTTAENLQLCPLGPHSALFAAMPFSEKAARAVSQLIGAPNQLHLDQVFLKPGRKGAGTSWHQDNDYFRIRDATRGTALWTAVHDATRANGTLRVIPRAFGEVLPHSRDPNSNHHVRCWPDEEKAIDVEIAAGGVVFFNYNVPHATGPNATDHERAGVALHYMHREEAPHAEKGYVARGMEMPVAEADGSLSRPDLDARWRELTAG